MPIVDPSASDRRLIKNLGPLSDIIYSPLKLLDYNYLLWKKKRDQNLFPSPLRNEYFNLFEDALEVTLLMSLQ